MLTLSRWKIILVALAIAFGLLFTLPNALPQNVRDGLPGFMPSKTLNLGLDLQGGSYLLLEVDTKALLAERLTNTLEDVRTQLREKQIAFSDLAVVNSAVSMRIVDPAQVVTASNLLRDKVGAPLAGAVGGRDIQITKAGDQRLRLSFVPEAIEAEAVRAVEQSQEIIRRRIDELGTRKEVEYAFRILDEGSSADRQLKVYRDTGSFQAVVDHLIAETKEGL